MGAILDLKNDCHPARARMCKADQMVLSNNHLNQYIKYIRAKGMV